MSQLIELNVAFRGTVNKNLDGYGFDVEDIVTPIKFDGTYSYFDARMIKGTTSANNNLAKVTYKVFHSLSDIASMNPFIVLLTVNKIRDKVFKVSEQMIFVCTKISENISPDGMGCKFFYAEDGDPLPVEYHVDETVSQVISQTSNVFIVQDRGSDQPIEPKLNFVGYTIEDNPSNSSIDIINVKEITWENLKNLRDASNLPIGATYKIIDRFNYQSAATGAVPNSTFKGDDRGFIYINAIDPGKLSSNVIRKMYCPLSYGSTINGVSSIGVWASSKTVIIGQVSIYGGKVWLNNTGAIGSALVGSSSQTGLDSTNWTYLSKEIHPEYYIDIEFKGRYDFDNDWIESQTDDNRNTYGISFSVNNIYYSLLFNPTDISDWNCKTNASAYEDNNVVGVWNNTSKFIRRNSNKGAIYANIMDSEISGNFNYGSIFSNKPSLSITGNYNFGAISGNSNSGYIQYNSNSGAIVNNLNSGDIYKNSINGSIQDLPNTVASFYDNSLYSSTGSDYFEIDITGLTTINLDSITSRFKGIVLLKSSNATETINLFSNFTALKSVIFNVKTGLTVTFTHNTGANQPRCAGGVNAVINGTKGEFIEFESRPSNVIRQKNSGKY